jgi:hypothetical protein
MNLIEASPQSAQCGTCSLRLPGELCSMICSFLGTQQQRILRRTMLHLMTEDFQFDRPLSEIFYNGSDMMTIFFDRELVLFPGQFRGVTSIRCLGNSRIEQTIDIHEHSPCLEDHLEHCCQAFEQLSRPRYLCGCHDNPWEPVVRDADIVQTLLDLRFDDA